MIVGSYPLRFSLYVVLAWAFSQSPGFCADAATPATNAAAAAEDSARAQALLERAVAHYKKNKDLAWADFDSKGEFVDGELYVYVVSTAGVMLASGGPSASLIGQNVTDYAR